jgi:lipopolysaccharide export system protein LptA
MGVSFRRAGAVLLFCFILGAGAFVWTTYQQRIADQKKRAAPPPSQLSEKLNSSADGFVYVTSDGGRTVAELRAKNARETKTPPRTELEQMELRLFHPDGKTYDLVKAARGEFFPAEGRLESSDDVEVRMAVPIEEGQGGKILGIKAKGARLEIKSGKVESAGAVEFQFLQKGGAGHGSALGADYDPQTRELHLHHQARLHWQPSDQKQDAMDVESEDVRYKEAESKVYLSPWSKMRKATFSMEAQSSEVLLDQGVIRQVIAADAKGADAGEKRSVEYAAKNLNVEFSPNGVAQKVLAEGDARLATRGDSGRTNTKADRIDLFFREDTKDSILEKATALGKAEVESIPNLKLPARGETKILRSEHIEMKMRTNGEEMDNVQIHAPGTLDFVPNRSGQRRRHMDAERMWIDYGAQNQIREFRAVSVKTRTEPLPATKRASAPMFTSSKDLLARFDQKTGELAQLEQWNEFEYQEGERRAKAEKAVQTNATQKVDLLGKARVWDRTSSTDADTIALDQKSGDFDAIGSVRSSRQEAKAEVTQATAERMEVREENKKIRYEGSAVLWKGENRLRAHRIDINRTLGTLGGYGSVVHQMVDSKSAAAQKSGAILTVVKSNSMDYNDKEKMAYYQGNVEMTRPGLNVRCERMRAYLAEENAESSSEQPGGEVEKIFANGKVDIVEKSGDRTRLAKGESSEYYTADGRLLIEGGKPEAIDIVKGVEQRRSTGRQIQWFANAERLIVDGDEKKPVVSTVQRKK